ncbi:polysaccharide deacetylase [Azospirillum sp. TSH7]|uniref:polysaccharide deacetylase family protein n=1 Tax=unclassified Azospirillum TaxID=2630922 RepID=UPI000D613590|nr:MULTISPECIES: polysaccharide deacetylase family protein [unclassified Azospirillum]PWC60995.1 polysaccharide deacetylase [Azospirillum sp. TSH20]PWC62771.1 polysaccharide deacetylase [Azospirillum sp. TSH7]
MMTLFRRAVLPLAATLLALPVSAMAGQRSYAATHGAAPFVTEHLIPGSDLDLDQVDRTLPLARVVALTIDDGPDANDPRILDILRAHGAKATFFYIGAKIPAHHDIAKQVAASGNEVGSHTQTHPMTTDLKPAEREWNLAQAEKALASVGVTATWFRPPFGDVDDALAALARRHGMATVLWTADSQDWKDSGPDIIRHRVTERLAPGAVVLMHSTKAATVAALPAILEEGERRGLRFVTMSEWDAAMRQSVTPEMALLHPAPRRR